MTKHDEKGPVDPLADPASPMDEASDEMISNEAAELRSQLDEAKERALRLHADWENYRKRARKELEDERRFADLSLLTDLLPVLDNMQRAIDAASKTPDGSGLLEGFKLVKQQLDNVLAQHHCTKIESLGKPFDPHLHEAISQMADPKYPPGSVMMVVRDGFQLHERVVRPSQVIVSAAPEG